MLIQISESADDILQWFEEINSPKDFSTSSENRKTFDAICMKLIAIGETIKRIDEKSDENLFARYKDVPWQEAMKTRDFFAHHYFEVCCGRSL